MIQRFIFDALKDGIAQFQSDPTLFDLLFTELFAFGETEIAAIKTVFAAKPPKVIHGYAPLDMEVPVWSIILQDEREALKVLNNDTGQIEDIDDPDFGADVKGTIWQHRYDILVYTEHPDVTTYYYEIAKSILLGSNDFFVDQDLFDIDISGGDLMPDPRYIPENVFVRRISFGCMRLFTRVDRDSRLGKAFKVSGIHIDKSGSPSDVGGVKTLVTIREQSLENEGEC